MALSNSSLKKLRQIVGKEHCTIEKEELVCYSYDATGKMYLPDAVIFPESSDDISAILKLANKERFFVIPRGAGSGMTGGSLPVQGGIVLVMKRLNRILEIDRDNLIARVQPGVVTGHFHEAVEKESLFYPPDPASSDFSTLGGNLAECAGGPRAVKYGVTRDYVLGLEAVLPTGDIIKTGVKTVKGVVGYDLTRLLVGSEGTLGIITDMTLRLLPLPESVSTITVVFDKMEAAAQTVSEIIRQGIIPRTIEYMDNASIRCTESYLKIGLPVDAGAMLIIEVDGKENETATEIEVLKSLCMHKGARDVKMAETNAERDDLWKARKAISPALYKYAPDKINEDIVVPRSRIPDMVVKIAELRERSGLTMATFGHAGDGNIHFNVMLDKKNRDELQKAEAAVLEVFEYTLELGGTISGEHGIGITKSSYIKKEIGETELFLMKQIKKVFDPNGILNPGKLFPAE
ncbi:MAG: FAD-binding protein [Deltaproteobacteria bacterium]|nr:FAD-binding protein [Deltaproteobacteria bacterium]